MFRTSVHGFFPDLSRAYNMVRIIAGKIAQKWAEGKQKLLRVSGRFELSRVRVAKGKITVNVRRKSTLVRVSARFKLGRVRVIGSQQWFMPADYRESRGVLSCGSLLKITLQDKIDLWVFLWLIFVIFSPFYYKFKVRFQWKFYTFFITRLGCYYLETGLICVYLRGRGTAKETCQSPDFKSWGVCIFRKTWVSDFNVHIPYNLGKIL